MQTLRLQPLCASKRAPALPPRPRRRLAQPVQASQHDANRREGPHPTHQHQHQDSLALLVFKAVVLVGTANAVAASLPAPAQAASGSNGGWHPRRHVLSKLRERYTTEETSKQVGAAAEGQATPAGAL